MCLLTLSADIHATTTTGATALHVACQNGKDSVIQHLIQNGANISAINVKGQTPLHLSAGCSSQSDGLELLVEAKAPLNERAKDGKTALHFACVKGPPSRVQMLITNGALVNIG